MLIRSLYSFYKKRKKHVWYSFRYYLDKGKCNGGDTVITEGCCTEDFPCGSGEGNCEFDEDCKDEFVMVRWVFQFHTNESAIAATIRSACRLHAHQCLVRRHAAHICEGIPHKGSNS